MGALWHPVVLSEKVKRRWTLIGQARLLFFIWIALLNNILDISRLESGVIDFHFEEEQLSRIVQIVMTEFEAKAAEKKIVIKFDPPPFADRIKMDSERIM